MYIVYVDTSKLSFSSHNFAIKQSSSVIKSVRSMFLCYTCQFNASICKANSSELFKQNTYSYQISECVM